MEQIKSGQWWENKLGQRVHILALTGDVKGLKKSRRQPVIGLNEHGDLETYSLDGQFYNDHQTDEDLYTLLPPECNSFDWKPESKWRDARPSDLTYPFKEARFRDKGSDWTHGQFAGYFPSLPYPWTNKTGTAWKHCQVKDE